MVNVRVLLVDANDDILDGLSAWIATCDGFEVVGVAHSARETYDRMFLLSPDVVLMDMSLPDANALDVTWRIKSRARPPLVVLMTFHDLAAIRAQAQAAGADACLAKPRITEDFPRIVSPLWVARQAPADAAAQSQSIPSRRRDS